MAQGGVIHSFPLHYTDVLLHSCVFTKAVARGSLVIRYLVKYGSGVVKFSTFCQFSNQFVESYFFKFFVSRLAKACPDPGRTQLLTDETAHETALLKKVTLERD